MKKYIFILIVLLSFPALAEPDVEPDQIPQRSGLSKYLFLSPATGFINLGPVNRNSNNLVISTVNGLGNSYLRFNAAGQGLQIGNNSVNILTQNTRGSILITPASFNGNTEAARFSVTQPADTAEQASTELFDEYFNNSVIKQHATGNITLNRDFLVTGHTDSFIGASVITNSATMGIVLPGCGTNATCTNISGVYHGSTALTTTGPISNSYVINLAADTGASSNYVAQLIGSSVVGPLISTNTKFTTSGCSVSSTTGGATAGVFTLGSNSCTVVVTINGATGSTAPNGWTCQAHDQTNPAVLIGGESSSTTTTASITVPAGAGTTDVISFSCTGY